MNPKERADLCGAVLEGRYRIIRRIGLGGTGVVFEASCIKDGGAVAIKTLRPCFVNHPDLGHRLRREYEIAQRVQHPGIVKMLDQGTLTDGSPFVVMPLMGGESLARVLLRMNDLPQPEVAALISRVAAILHASHTAGYVHRDVKPEHVLLSRTGTGDLAVHLLDFGVCSSKTAGAEERKREIGKVFGTPSYVSPEQAAGQVDIDGRADLFSLGLVMFEALTGRIPFTGSTVSKLLVRIIRERAPRVSAFMGSIDPRLDDIVACCLAREASGRFPSARAVSRALAPHIGDRKLVERRLAAMLSASAHHSDTAPTVRCTVPVERQKVA